jgi:hypothetical protein
MGAPDKVTGLGLYQRSCCAMDNTSDYESEDCRLSSARIDSFFLGQEGIRGQFDW